MTGLAQACLSADGGQPFAADPGFLRQGYLSGARAHAGFAGTELVCVSSLRLPAGAQGDGAAAVTTGLAHPAWRRRGIGGHAFGWAADQVGKAGVRAETEALGDGAHALYLSRGLVQVMAEDVLQLPAAAPVPPVPLPGGTVLPQWGRADPGRFHAVHQASFAGRPGFGARPLADWVQWLSGDEGFRPDWVLLATAAGTGTAVIACDAGGWVTVVGVIPPARGQGYGAALMSEGSRRIRDAGETTITLDVSIDNPHAAGLYRRLGFAPVGRRAKYAAAP